MYNKKLRDNIIRDLLMRWYKLNKRNFPWRLENIDPYHVLIAEIFLRQTRAIVVERVYEKFINRYPNIDILLSASEDDLLTIMKPLGISSRVQEIKKLMKIIKIKYDGKIPINKKTLQKLPGVGEYTASAIRIFAFNRRDLMIDTNIKRMILRIYGTNNLVEIYDNLKNLSKDVNIRDFFYMCLDFGALVCKSTSPLCHSCPIQKYCNEYLIKGF